MSTKHGATRPFDAVREGAGRMLGRLWAPGVAAVARFRKARMFHPRGTVAVGHITAITGGHFDALGAHFEGDVMARASAALWKHELPWFEVLGIALRMRAPSGPAFDADARTGDQDLLFATIRSPLTLGLAPFTTDARDLCGQRYWAVSPFAAEGLRVELRLMPDTPSPHEGTGTRLERFQHAVTSGLATWTIEARQTLTLQWHPIAHLVLASLLEVDQERLAFDPFRTGRDIEPVGFIHAIRRAAYPASADARPRQVTP